MHPYGIVFLNHFVDSMKTMYSLEMGLSRVRFYVHAYLYKLGGYVIRHNTEQERLVIKVQEN